MAITEQTGITRPISLMWALCGWNKYPAGRDDDCRELFEDPENRLSEGSVDFPSLGFRIYLIWLPLLVVVEVLLKFFVFDRAKHEGDVFIYWAGTIGALAIYLVAPLLVITRRLRLDVEGFHILQGQKDLFIPWDVLNPGRDCDIGFFQIKIPVLDGSRDRILVTMDTKVTSISDGANPLGLKFDNPTEVSLTWPFVLDPRVFVEVAKRMAPMAPTHHAIPSAFPVDGFHSRRVSPTVDAPTVDSQQGIPPGITLLASGAVQVPVSAVTFPAVCCRCGEETSDIRDIQARTRRYWWFPSQTSASLQMFVCQGCWTTCKRRFLALVFTMEILWTLLITWVVYGSLNQSWQTYEFIAMIALILTRMSLSLLPSLWWNVADVVLNFSTHEFRIRFAKPDYHELMLAEIRLRDSTSTES